MACANRFYAFIFMRYLGLMQVFCTRVNVVSESIIFGEGFSPHFSDRIFYMLHAANILQLMFKNF